MKDKLEKIREAMKVQGSNGNWNYDPYMNGMYNGMELIVAILEGRDPEYRDAPDIWFKDSLRESVKTMKMNNFKWSESSETTTTTTSEYYYKTFDDYFKTIAPYLWDVNQWDNETIKAWLENSFEDARTTK